MPRTNPRDQRTPIFHCPFCENFTQRGGAGKVGLDKHIEQNHPERFVEYSKLKRDDIRYYETPMGGVPSIFPTKEDDDMTSEKKPSILSIPDAKQNVVSPHGETIKEEEIPMQESTPKPDTQKKLPQQNEVQQTQSPAILQIPFQIQPVFQQAQQQQPVTEQQQTTAFIPEWRSNSDPIQWFETFMKYYQFKPVFIKIQLDRAKRLNQLPNAQNFMADLKSMDSGQSSLQTIQYIAQEYDAKVQEFLTQRQESFAPTQMGYPLTPQQAPNPYTPGVPLYHQQQQQPLFFPQQQSENEKQLMQTIKDMQAQLNAEKDRAVQRERELQQQQIAKLEATITQMQQNQQNQQNNPQSNFQMEQIKLMLQQSQEALQRERDLRQQQQYQSLQDAIRSAPSEEGLLSKVQQLIRQEHDVVTARDIDQKIQNAVKTVGSVSQLDVDLKKAENELFLEQAKLETDKEKTAMWQDSLKTITEGVSQTIGQALSKQPANGQPPQNYQGNMPVPDYFQVACPNNCGEILMYPSNIRDAICPKCTARMEITPDGRAILRQKPQTKTVSQINTPSVPAYQEVNIPPPPPDQPLDEPDEEENELHK